MYQFKAQIFNSKKKKNTTVVCKEDKLIESRPGKIDGGESFARSY